MNVKMKLAMLLPFTLPSIWVLAVLAATPVNLPLILNLGGPSGTPSATPTATNTLPSPTTGTPSLSPTATRTPFATATRTPFPAVDVLSYCVDDFSNTVQSYINGEVQNNAGYTVDNVNITAYARASDDSLLWTKSVRTTISVMEPGTKSPFKFIAVNYPEDVHHVDLVVEAREAGSSHRLQELTVLSTNAEVHEYTMQVMGSARNDTDRDASYPIAVVSLYDSVDVETRRLVGSDRVFVNPSTVLPGETCEFDVAIYGICTPAQSWDVRVVDDYYDWTFE